MEPPPLIYYLLSEGGGPLNATVRPHDKRMRLKGRLANWKDEKGFGFITPSDGGNQIFVHISSFANRSRRPAGNDLVTYKLTTDAKGRLQAIDVEFTGNLPRPKPSNKAEWLATAFASAFMAGLLAAVVTDIYPIHLLTLYSGASLVAFLMYWHDKSAAQNLGWRTAENSLHLIGLIGGWPGALIAIQVLRHKSKKRSFQLMFWMTVLLNFAGLLWLASPSGAKVMDSIFGRI